MVSGTKRNSCRSCDRTVAKTAHALQCMYCEVWEHVGCGTLMEDDYAFMKNRSKHGFRWICGDCLGAADGREGRISVSNVSALIKSSLEEMQDKINERLDALEKKMDGAPHVEQSTSFASILKETFKSSKNECEAKKKMTINTFGQERTVSDEQVLIVKPKPGRKVDAAGRANAYNNLKGALETVQVNSVNETREGALVVRFPTLEAKTEAGNLMDAHFEGSENFVVSQPKKMLPKMTNWCPAFLYR